jgi:hypothetical protein
MKRLAILSSLSSIAVLVGACATSGPEGSGDASTTQALTANDDGPTKGHHRHGWRHGPPPQAVAACADSTEGASCTFEGRRGTVEGTCSNRPHADGLVCAPEGRGRGRRGPPPQAIEACASSAQGASCSFEGFRGNVQGSCIDHPRVDGLVCAPEGRRGPWGKRPGRRGHRGPPPQAVEACADAAEGATCSFNGFRGNVEGTCIDHPRVGGLVCAPEGRRGPWGPGHRGHRRGPPPQAVEACASSAAGAACSFQGFRGNVEGSCIDHPRADGLVCAPEWRRGPRRGPPAP